MNYLESYLDKYYFPKEFIKGQFKDFDNLLDVLGSIPTEKKERKEFFDKHRVKIEEYTCPKNYDEFTEYILNMTSSIEQSGEKMDIYYYN